MARKSHFDFYLELLNRCLLAWEVLRLNPEFRSDYKKYKPYIDWIRLHYTDAMTQGVTPEKEWVLKFTNKWGLSFEDVLRWDPHKESPGITLSTEFPACKARCIRFEPNSIWGFSMRCKKARIIRHDPLTCFAAYNNSIAILPFANRLNSTYVYRDSHPLIGIKQTGSVQKFIKTEGRAKRLLLWVRSDALREVALLQILEQIRKAKLQNPYHKSQGRTAVKIKPDNGYVVFSISLHTPPQKTISAIKKRLKETLPSYPFSQVANSSEALSIYEERIYNKVPLGKLVGKIFGPAKASKHKSEVEIGSSSTYGRALTDRIARAKKLIQENRIPPPQLTRPSSKRGSKKNLLSTLLPKTAPPLKP